MRSSDFPKVAQPRPGRAHTLESSFYTGGRGAGGGGERCSSSQSSWPGLRMAWVLWPWASVPSTLRTTPQQLSLEKESELLIPAPSDLTLMPGDVFSA